MSINLFNKVRTNEPLIKDKSTLHAFGGEVLVPLGKTNLKCVLKKTTRDLTFYVLNLNSVTLLGNCACQELGLISFDKTVHKLQILFDPLSKFRDLFDKT